MYPIAPGTRPPDSIRGTHATLARAIDATDASPSPANRSHAETTANFLTLCLARFDANHTPHPRELRAAHHMTDPKLAAFVTNITDEVYLTNGVNVGGLGYVEAYYSRPREWGISASAKF